MDPTAGMVNFGEWAARWYRTTAGLQRPANRYGLLLVFCAAVPRGRHSIASGLDHEGAVCCDRTVAAGQEVDRWRSSWSGVDASPGVAGPELGEILEGIDVRPRVEDGNPAECLVELSEDAELVVPRGARAQAAPAAGLRPTGRSGTWVTR